MNAGNLSGAALEKALAAKLEELLLGVPWLRNLKILRNPAVSERAFDIQATWPLPAGGRAELWVDCRADPRPSQFPYAAFEQRFDKDKKRVSVRVPVFAAPHISPRMAEICWSHNWSWFDLAGNCRLSVPGALYIERRGNEPVHVRSNPAANLSTSESARIIRALLAPDNAAHLWTQREMQKHCQPNVSLGLVNKVVQHLRDEAFVEIGEGGGFRLRDPLKLLFAWRDAYRFDRHERRGYFTLLQGKKLREAMAGFDLIRGGHAAYAAFSAADFQAPHVRQPKTWLYITSSLEDEFCARVEAKLVDSGENLVVFFPDDEGVFFLGDAGTAGDERLPCTNAVQTYVDLCHCGGRGEEAAEALLNQRLKPEWKRQGLTV